MRIWAYGALLFMEPIRPGFGRADGDDPRGGSQDPYTLVRVSGLITEGKWFGEHKLAVALQMSFSFCWRLPCRFVRFSKATKHYISVFLLTVGASLSDGGELL